jgi:sulfite exporter TauE/SafE
MTYWVELAGILALILIVSRVFAWLGIDTSFAPSQGVVSLGAVFAVGLVASSSSCIALAGGLLLSFSAAWRDTHASETRWQRLEPLLLFNAGRLGGYFVLGGAVGVAGEAFSLSSRLTGILTLALAAVMIWLGLSILHILPRRMCRIPVPHSWSGKLQRFSHRGTAATAVFLGALTFFVPCGFTQSMQLVALGSGGFLRGGLIMLAFALGTLPSLLGISLLSSLTEGAFSRWFLRLSGVLVLLLGLLNIQSGLLLLGIDVQTAAARVIGVAQIHPTNDPNVTINAEGKQIIAVTVTDQGYIPDTFTIQKGKETWVYASAARPLSGCANFLLAPAFNIETPVKTGGNWLGPIPNPQGDFILTCSMGMLRANVHVQ